MVLVLTLKHGGFVRVGAWYNGQIKDTLELGNNALEM